MQKIYLSANIKYLRTINKKTQEELAKYCQKTKTAVCNWEKGIREPNAVDIALISNFFNVSTDDLIKNDMRIKEN